MHLYNFWVISFALNAQVSRRQIFEHARHEQEQLRAEVQSRGRVNQGARLHALHEIADLKKIQKWEMTGVSPE